MELSREIKKIPFKMACQDMGLTEVETSKLLSIESNKKLIDDGPNDLYYLLMSGLYESDGCAKYSSFISLENSSKSSRELYGNYMKLVNFCFSPKIGLSLAKSNDRFTQAAEEFALFGKLEVEDEEIFYGKNPSTISTQGMSPKFDPKFVQKTPTSTQRHFRNFPRVPPSNVILFNTRQVLMPILYKPMHVFYPFIPNFVPRFPRNSYQWLTRVSGDYQMGRVRYPIVPIRPTGCPSSQCDCRNCKAAKEEKNVEKIKKVEEVTIEPDKEKESV